MPLLGQDHFLGNISCLRLWLGKRGRHWPQAQQTVCAAQRQSRQKSLHPGIAGPLSRPVFPAVWGRIVVSHRLAGSLCFVAVPGVTSSQSILFPAPRPRLVPVWPLHPAINQHKSLQEHCDNQLIPAVDQQGLQNDCR